MLIRNTTAATLKGLVLMISNNCYLYATFKMPSKYEGEHYLEGLRHNIFANRRNYRLHPGPLLDINAINMILAIMFSRLNLENTNGEIMLRAEWAQERPETVPKPQY